MCTKMLPMITTIIVIITTTISPSTIRMIALTIKGLMKDWLTITFELS